MGESRVTRIDESFEALLKDLKKTHKEHTGIDLDNVKATKLLAFKLRKRDFDVGTGDDYRIF